MSLVRYAAVAQMILALAPRRLTLREVCRRARGRGFDRLQLIVGPVLEVNSEFGCAIEKLTAAGVIRLEHSRGGVRVLPGPRFRSFSAPTMEAWS